MGDTVVLVPYDEGTRAAVPGVHAVRYDRDGRCPRGGLRAVSAALPRVDAGRPARRRLPELRLVRCSALAPGLGRAAAGAGRAVGLPVAPGRAVASCLAVYRELPGLVRSQDARGWDQRSTDELAGKRVLLVGAATCDNTGRRLAPFEVATTLVQAAPRRRPRHRGRACAAARPRRHRTDRPPTDAPRAGRRPVPRRDARRRPAGQRRARPRRRHRRAGPRSCRPVGCGRRGRHRPRPLPADHPLWTAPGLLLTPHVGGSVPGGLRRAFGVAVGAGLGFARGDAPPNLVEDGYSCRPGERARARRHIRPARGEP